MPRKAKLSPLEVRRLVQPGRWSVGGLDGLALQVTDSGARSWLLRFSTGVTLADARDKARQLRAFAREGVDPIAAREARRSAASAEQQAQRTFSEVAAQYIAQLEMSWKNSKHQTQGPPRCEPLLSLRSAEIDACVTEIRLRPRRIHP